MTSDTNSFNKSNRYEAGKYPIYFEHDHRTENDGILPPKDRLKEFESKHVDKYLLNLKTKSNININNNSSKANENNIFENNDNEINNDTDNLYDNNNNNNNILKPTFIEKNLYSTVTSNFISTAYTSFYKTNNKLPVLINNNNIKVSDDNNQLVNNLNTVDYSIVKDQIKKEIKSNYIYHRPDYELSNLEIEKKVFINKNKDLKEKRNLEENKEFIDKWGKSRAFYKENLIAKAEMIENIKNLNNLIETSKIDKQNQILLNKNAFAEYKEKDIINIDKDINTEKDNKTDVKDGDRIEDNEDNEEEEFEENIPVVLPDYKVKKIDYNNNNPKTISTNVEKDIIKKLGISNINIKERNIIYNEYNIINYNFNCSKKQDINNTYNNLKVDIEINDKTLPSDIVCPLKFINPLFGVRTNYNKFIDVNQIDSVKYTHINSFKPLSINDTYNIKNRCNKNNIDSNMINNLLDNVNIYNNKQRPITGSDLIRSNYFKLSSINNNLNNLKMRRIMTKFNSNIAEEIKENELKHNINYNIQYLKNTLLPNENNKILNIKNLPTIISKEIELPVDNAKTKRPKSKRKK